jgi:hypothetical protein
MKNRKSDDDARDTFEKVGDDDEVENLSGAPWPGSQVVARPRTITAPPPGQRVSPRRQGVINATSGETLDADLAKGLTAAARQHMQFGEAVDRADPGEQPMLRHIFGLPERDRA